MKHILILFLLLSTSLYAQRPNNDRIKAARAMHISDALDLSSAEAEKFWPIYNAVDDELAKIRRAERTEIFAVVKAGGVDALSEEEAATLINKSISFKEQELQIRKRLTKDLQGVISHRKILKLFKAEEDFKKKLLERMRKRIDKRKNK